MNERDLNNYVELAGLDGELTDEALDRVPTEDALLLCCPATANQCWSQ
jgi:hypothetical protein